MSIVQFQCPSCQAPLRLQDRALFVGRTFDCPDCRESLLIEADGSTGVKATPRSRPSTRSVNVSLPNVCGAMTSPSVWDRLSQRPAMLGWIVAALFAVILLIVVKPGRDRALTELKPPLKEDAQPTKPADDHQPAMEDPGEAKSEVAAELEPVVPKIDTPKEVAKRELPPPPEPPAVVEPAPVADKPPAEEPKPVAPAVLSPEGIEAKLAQKIARFDQSKPVPFVKLLDTIEELAGVPIVWNLERVDDEQLQKPVTLQLKQTTVGEILDTLLKQVGLERRTIEGRIELHPPARKD